MELTILAASGATGLELTRQALERGHVVTAIARTPGNITVADSPRLIRVAADVRDRRSVEAALEGAKIVLSGLGIASGDKPGALTAGALAVVAAQPHRAIWLGAFGTGPSARAAGAATRTLLKMMGDKLSDKVAADAAVLAAGGTVFHAGPLSDGPLSPTRRTVGLADAPKRFFPSRVSRATVAAAMLDEAEDAAYRGAIAIPLER
ncbi:NAD(P)H-binding protein [Umezawaea sp. Da 62-37]|uniref:NAD(P)-dependent oxidoreductase n=1 Tax=Umezawaea sp. Da 62-37 TaxID=3075927 RepID=UPI0028F6EE68|nr:NAD(P)H-binding protein [Umezawaea sp. Da 62-37]WNV87020.1 NAD(P)H-binding protein [Umezawaea sp. Da 62-37]